MLTTMLAAAVALAVITLGPSTGITGGTRHLIGEDGLIGENGLIEENGKSAIPMPIPGLRVNDDRVSPVGYMSGRQKLFGGLYGNVAYYQTVGMSHLVVGLKIVL